MSEPAPSVARSAVWNHLGKMGDYVLMYAGSVIIARGLGIEAYGHYATLISGIHVLLVLSSFGLEAALTRHCASLQGEDAFARARFLGRRGVALRFGLFLLAAAGGLAVALLSGWFPSPVDHLLLLLVGGYGLTRGVVPVAVAVLTARFRTRHAAVIAIAGRLFEIIAFLSTGASGLTTVFAIFLASGVLQVLLHVLWCRDLWFGPETAVPLRPVVVFGGVFWLNALVDYFLGRQGDIALLAFIGGDPAATSRYDVSYSLLQAGAMVATLGLSGVALAALSRYPAGDGASRTRLYETLVRVNSFLTIPVLGFLFIAARDVLGLLYAGPFVAAVPVLQILLGMRIMSRLFAGGENADFLLSMDLVRPLVVVGIVAALVTVLLHFVLIPRFMAEGAAVASGCGTLVTNGLGFHRVRRAVPVRIQWRSWLSLTVVTAAAGIVTSHIVPDAATLLPLAAKGMVYIAVWYLLAMLTHPIESEDAAALGRALPVLRRPLRLLAGKGGPA